MSAYTVPYYIGYPGAQKFDVNGDNEYFKKDMDRRFQIARIKPLDVSPALAANLFKSKDAWDEYAMALNANGINISDEERELKVVCNTLTTAGETFTNDYGQSDLVSGIQNFGDKYRDIAFAFGINNMEDFLNEHKDDGGIGGTLASAGAWLNEGADSLINMTGKAAPLLSTMKKTMMNPQNKIDFPNFWKSSGYQCQYEVSTSLFCYNVQDDNEYTSNIIAAYAALMQFVLPRSKEGDLYSWPFLLSFKIPGIVNLPFCYMSNVSVIKGGDQNDLSYAYRPNSIELKMTISPLFNVMYNITEKDNNNFNTDTRRERPTLLRELDTLSEKRTFGSDGITVEDEGSSTLVSSRLTQLQNTESVVDNLADTGRTALKSKYAEEIAVAYATANGVPPEVARAGVNAAQDAI